VGSADRASIIAFDRSRRLDRGDGIVTVPLVTRDSVADPLITTGISTYPTDTGAPRHWHNCDEQVTVLAGVAEAEIEGARSKLTPYDTTYIKAGLSHAFRNLGDAPMTILWIYSGSQVTRTLVETGRTVTHLTSEDLLGKRTPPNP
jgi:mannose-6-phosphate isomerase-like protein (cupin superfamily)